MITPRVPRGTGVGGKRLWASLMQKYSFSEDELALVRQLTRMVDLLDQLQAVLERDGAAPEGRPNPIAVEIRQQSIALARIHAALRLPETPTQRPQRRSGVRGAYSMKVV